MSTLRFQLLAFSLAFIATGCTGSDGDVCFEDGDCSSGLVCCKTTASATARGRCLPVEDRCSVAPRPDAGDTSTGDAGDAATDAPVDAPADTTPPMDATMPCDPAMDECGMRYCRLASCSDAVGQCVERPASCDGVLDPTCGCDSRTYTSACEANRAGESVDHAGACGSPTDSGVMDTGSDAPADATTD
jgi:hypothetical protein